MKTYTLILLMLISAMLLFGCSSNMTDDPFTEDSTVQFGAQTNESSQARGPIDSGAKKMFITYELVGSGVSVDKELRLFQLGLDVISEQITLTPGTYQLTRFILLDNTDTALYATPLTGSVKEYLVDTPLPIEFTVNAGMTTSVTPEVVKVGNATPGEFGYHGFDFQIVDTFDFAVEVKIPTSSGFVSTTASILIESSATTLYSGDLVAGLNIIEVNDEYADYSVTITKDGYVTDTASYTHNELQDFITIPMLVTLTPVAIAIKSVKIVGAYASGAGSSDFYWHKVTSSGNDAGQVSDASGVAFPDNTDMTMNLTSDLVAGDYFAIVWGGGSNVITKTLTFYDQSDDPISVHSITDEGGFICRELSFTSPDTYYRFYFDGIDVTTTKITL